MNAGNWTLFDVTSGNTYEWTYCEEYGGVSTNWHALLTLINNSSSENICGSNSNVPFISWVATFTGVIKLLTSQSNCASNIGAPYNTLVWRQTNGIRPNSILGIDVSHWDGTINWTQVKNAPKVFSWCKATEGNGYTDATFVTNMTNGAAAGVVMGAYHFGHPITYSASSEVTHFLNVAGTYITSCSLPPVLDLEDPSGGPSLTSSMTSNALTTWVQAWMTGVQNQTGITPVIYTNGSIASYLNSSVNTYPLWIANPNGNTNPPTNIGVWNTWAVKQYSFTGTVPGINAQVDLNVFNGNMAAFNAFIGCTANLPVADFTASTTHCTGQAIALTDISTNSPTSWNWTLTGGTPATSTLQNPSVTYNTPGTYTITLTASNSAGTSAPVSHTGIVNASPAIPTITVSGNTLTSSSASNNQWYLNGAIINGAVSQTYTATVNGSYTVIVTNSFNCSSTSVPTVLTTTGIDSFANNTSLTVFPNPSNGIVNINLKGKNEHIKIEVVNNLGQRVYVETLDNCDSDCNKSINMSSLKKGIYLLKIAEDGNIHSKRILLVD